MNNVERYYRDGSITINVDYKPVLGAPIICLNDGLWYKFQIDRIEELDDNTFNITSENLVSVDTNIIKK